MNYNDSLLKKKNTGASFCVYITHLIMNNRIIERTVTLLFMLLSNIQQSIYYSYMFTLHAAISIYNKNREKKRKRYVFSPTN